VTNNYLKVTTRTNRTPQEVSHLRPITSSKGYPKSDTIQTVHSLVWFFTFNDRSSSGFSAAKASADAVNQQCSDEFKPRFRGCDMSVYRDFPGNVLPVIVGIE
jgi:hypothetical protein